MKSNLSLDDLTLFLAVAEAGGLQGAAAATGTSAPTLSRRMAELERATGQHLFQRGPQGFALTAEGRALMAEAAPLREVRRRLARWGSDAARTPRVRITAGTWTARHIARHLGEVWAPGDPWVPEFLAANANLDLARREADIGIRARRPEHPWLAAKRTHARLDYAVYGRADAPDAYITLDDGQATTPAERWVRDQPGARIATEVNTMRLGLDLALSGIGRIVMPVFAGAEEPGLVQLSPVIDAIAHEEWLVSHAEARNDPPVRRALMAMERLLMRPRAAGKPAP
jgi:DNA-binding transcriptional LysR family regulator